MGSFHYSFQKLGFKCVMASDIYKPAKENYKKYYHENKFNTTFTEQFKIS